MKYFLTYIFAFLVFSACKTKSVDSTPLFVKPTDSAITYQGRTGENETKTATEIYWSGSSIKINFEGTEVKAIFDDENGENYFNIIIDGVNFEVLKLKKGKETYVLADSLTKGKHSIEITKRNDWDYGTTLFYGFEIEGKVLEPDAENRLFIEFYGDSVTSGHGNEDYLGNDSSNGDVTNNYNAYAAITARYFNADYTCVVRSGIGVMVSWYNLIMPEMYDRLNPNNPNSKWDFTKKQPDIVVVNLFQNDYWIVNLPEHEEFKRRFGTDKPTEKDIVKSYADFIKTIRNLYPITSIVCVLGNMNITKNGSEWPNYVTEAVTSLNDANTYTCFVPYKDTPGHPKVAEHQIIANELINTIKNNNLNSSN
ncbi:GDSL-like Lipase/Acylhydrolase family protein [Lutibacter agarilyticus]|uniref:GDSL-like Lipase/Acylhydrolase family protein n=1 Tax=Lutibacter agarilyticus TaxID=1109740 RepID=A0A238VA22_9FLAO|nr:SGNH/GDSL hydrolase family protein [Lutibacter agarilyticus]SNR30897.1 GDSL-like Lipase/Acylhydrolase family protein [Lutibacter agarilyticus]